MYSVLIIIKNANDDFSLTTYFSDAIDDLAFFFKILFQLIICSTSFKSAFVVKDFFIVAN